MAYPRFRRARAHKFITWTDATTLNSTAWADVPNANVLTLGAQAGDTLEVLFNGSFSNEGVDTFFDVVTEVGGTPTNSFGTQGAIDASGFGISGWELLASTYYYKSASGLYTVQSGDISDGKVSLQLRYRTSSASDRTMVFTNSRRAMFAVKNLGPAAE